MKQFLILAVLGLSTLAFRPVQSDGIVKALKQGDAEQLSKYFDNLIDIKLPEKEEIKNVGKNQAEITITEFFEDAKVKGFDVTSQREMSGTMYMAGKLYTAKKDFNVTLMIKSKGDKSNIITIRIN